jgi:DNA polymerase III delta subunit
MITVIHGDDTASSRGLLHSLKEKSPDSPVLKGSSVDLTSLAQLFESDNLFGSSTTIFIEDLLTSKKQSSDQDAILSYLNKHSEENIIYIWEGKEVTKTVLNKLQHVASRLYKLPQSLFQFLDSISPQSKKGSLLLFHRTIATAEPELVFFMLIRHFRLLLALSKEEAAIDEVKRMSPWQKTKIKKQAASFSQEALKKHHRQLHEIDHSHKTGASPYPLSTSIDIFLMSL